MVAPSNGIKSNGVHRPIFASRPEPPDFADPSSGPETPSDEEPVDAEEYSSEDAGSIIGVSIGQAQTRLTSPKTPAAEKAAAMEDLDGGAFFPGELDAARGQGAGEEGEGEGEEEEAFSEVVPPSSDQQKSFNDDLASPFHGAPAPKPVHDKPPSAQRPAGPPLRGPRRDRDTGAPEYRLPSPWRAGPKKFQRTDETREFLRANLDAAGHSGQRRRAFSGSSATENFKKLLPFSIPSLPKGAIPSLPKGAIPSLPKTSALLNFSFPNLVPLDANDRREAMAKFRKSPLESIRAAFATSDTASPGDMKAIQRTPTSPQLSDPNLQRTGPKPQQVSLASAPHPATFPVQGTLRRAKEAGPADDGLCAPHHPRLRRVASDDFILLHHTLSRASSLGDDSRFEDVQGQVNSRFQAIKDSLQDANFKFPALPKNLPSLRGGFGSSRTDLSQPNQGSGLRTSYMADGTTRKALPKTAGIPAASAQSHPFLAQALHDLTGDVVVLGGYRGSILRSAEPPYRQLWAPIKIGLNLRKVDLEVGLDPEDEENMETRIRPGGMLTHIGPVDISRRLLKRMRGCENARRSLLRVHNYGYDWRLSPHLLSRRLIEYLEALPCNAPGVAPEKRGATVVAHSLGGLITRHAVNQRPELFAGVVYAGVPNTCVNILGPMRNGDDVLLSSRVLTAQVNFTIRTSFVLLPLDGKCFIDKYTKKEYPVDFFDVNTWIEHSLSPCVAPPLPQLTAVQPSGISSVINSMASVLPNITSFGRRSSIPKSSNPLNITSMNAPSCASILRETTSRAGTAVTNAANEVAHPSQAAGLAPHISSDANATEYGASQNASISTAVTIPRSTAIAYLRRTLAEVKQFKLELAHRPHLSALNRYPPISIIYGKSTPTVYGAKVASWDSIKRADAYDELVFASGDGVVLAKAAQVPEGYRVVRGGVVASERGHIGLLGDLEAVGRCLGAVLVGRKRGVGLGEAAAPEGTSREREGSSRKTRDKRNSNRDTS